jgi:hypothetical protein
MAGRVRSAHTSNCGRYPWIRIVDVQGGQPLIKLARASQNSMIATATDPIGVLSTRLASVHSRMDFPATRHSSSHPAQSSEATTRALSRFWRSEMTKVRLLWSRDNERRNQAYLRARPVGCPRRDASLTVSDLRACTVAANQSRVLRSCMPNRMGAIRTRSCRTGGGCFTWICVAQPYY